MKSGAGVQREQAFWLQVRKNTITAPVWTFLCAKLFGSKSTGQDGNTVTTLSFWRGKYYITGVKQVGQKEKQSG